MNAPSPRPAPAMLADPAPVAAALCVLVVEDDALIGDLLRELITEMGHYVCLVVATEAEAVAAAGRYNPQLIITDLNLAAGDGLTAVSRIRRLRPVPYLLMSGGGALQEPGGGTILRKPFSLADLRQAMQLALQPLQ